MEKEHIKLAIEGYNKEKVLLVNRLSQLSTCNATIATRGSIEDRLLRVDIQINTLLQND